MGTRIPLPSRHTHDNLKTSFHALTLKRWKHLLGWGWGAFTQGTKQMFKIQTIVKISVSCKPYKPHH